MTQILSFRNCDSKKAFCRAKHFMERMDFRQLNLAEQVSILQSKYQYCSVNFRAIEFFSVINAKFRLISARSATEITFTASNVFLNENRVQVSNLPKRQKNGETKIICAFCSIGRQRHGPIGVAASTGARATEVLKSLLPSHRFLSCRCQAKVLALRIQTQFFPVRTAL